MFDDRPHVRERLETDIVAWLTTVDPDGRPQPSLVWFVVDGDVIVVYSRAGTPRVRNIERDPFVALHLNSDAHGEGPIVVEGRAEIIGPEPTFDRHAAYFGKYEQHLDRWGFTVESYRADYPILLHLHPERLRAK